MSFAKQSAAAIGFIAALAATEARGEGSEVVDTRSAPAVSESVIVTPRNPRRPRSSFWITAADSPAGRRGSSAGYTAHELITSLTPAAIAAR